MPPGPPGYHFKAKNDNNKKNNNKIQKSRKFPYILIYSPLLELRVGSMGGALYYYVYLMVLKLAGRDNPL